MKKVTGGKGKALTLTVDEPKCIGCGLCITLADKTFGFDKCGKSIVINQGGDDDKKINDAIEACPVVAISWRSDNRGKSE